MHHWADATEWNLAAHLALRMAERSVNQLAAQKVFRLVVHSDAPRVDCSVGQTAVKKDQHWAGHSAQWLAGPKEL